MVRCRFTQTIAAGATVLAASHVLAEATTAPPPPPPPSKTTFVTPRPAATEAPMLTDKQLDALVLPEGLSAKAAGKFLIVYNGYRRSHFDPCGCPSHPLGGLDKEARLVERIKAAELPTLMVDAGGVIRELGGDADISNSGAILQELSKFGYRVANVGFPDILPGVDRFKALAKDTGIKLISANIAGDDDKPVFAPYAVETVTVDGKPVRVGFIGVTRQRISGSAGMDLATRLNPADSSTTGQPRLLDPAASIRKVLPDVQKESDMVVVLYYGRRDSVASLLSGVGATTGSISAVLCAEYSGYSPSTIDHGATVLTGGYEGRQFGTLGVVWDGTKPTKLSGRLVEVTQNIPPVEAVTKKLAEAKAAAAKIPPASRPVPAPPANFARPQMTPKKADPQSTAP